MVGESGASEVGVVGGDMCGGEECGEKQVLGLTYIGSLAADSSSDSTNAASACIVIEASMLSDHEEPIVRRVSSEGRGRGRVKGSCCVRERTRDSRVEGSSEIIRESEWRVSDEK